MKLIPLRTASIYHRAFAVGFSSIASLLTSSLVYAAGESLFTDPEPSSFFLVLFLFSMFGGVGRLLFVWRIETPWQRQVGSLLLSVFGSWLVALYFWEAIRPTTLMASAGAMAAVGGEVVEQVARLFIPNSLRNKD